MRSSRGFAVVAAFLPACMFFRSLDDLSRDRADDGGLAAVDAGMAAESSVPADGGSDATHESGRDANTIALGGPSLCDGSSPSPLSLLCDGFESAQLGPPWYTPPTATPDTLRAARGARSLHVHLDAGVSSAPSYVAAPLPFAKPWASVFARVFLFAPSGQPIPNTGLLLFYFNGTGYAGADLASTGDGRFAFRAPPNYAGVISDVAIARDRWLCIELEVYPTDAGVGGIRAWLDLVPVAATLGGVETAKIDTVQLGVQANTTAPLDLWFDELVVATERVGCAR